MPSKLFLVKKDSVKKVKVEPKIEIHEVWKTRSYDEVYDYYDHLPRNEKSHLWLEAVLAFKHEQDALKKDLA